MEPAVLNWFYQTEFWKTNKDSIDFQPGFEIGKYLRQLDHTYQHPAYKVDFLIVYVDANQCEHRIIIEYDGFAEHFKDADEVNAFNYERYYSEDDVYRQKVLESYGYSFIRINRFNVGQNPVVTLNDRIASLVKGSESESDFLDTIEKTVDGLENGNKKECPKCSRILDLSDFRDTSLISGVGRICRNCKVVRVVVPPEPRPQRVMGAEKCPRCGAQLILRVGRLGRFYGCSRFPRCRGTRNVR